MGKLISIDQLEVGMFIEAQVLSALVDGEIRHFLEPRDGVFAEATNKRARLTRDKHMQVLTDGGLLVTTDNYIAALRQTGIAKLSIDPSKGKDVPEEERPSAPVSLPDENDSVPADDHPEKQGNGEWLQHADKLFQTSEQEDDSSQAQSRLADAPLDLYAKLGEYDDDDGEVAVNDFSEYGSPADRRTAPPPETVSGRRQNFGPGQAAWMKVEIDEHGIEATMTVLCFGNRTGMDKDDIVEAIDELYGIRNGLDMSTIERLARQAAASPHRVIRGEFSIARCEKRKPHELGHIVFSFSDKANPAEDYPFPELKKAYEQTVIDDVITRDLLARPVAPGEELARFVANETSDAPRNIFNEFQQPASPEQLLKAGDHVELQGETYTAKTFGYVLVLDGELSVLPAVWTSPDHIEAHYIYFPQEDQARNPDWEELVQVFEIKDIRYGLREDDIQTLLNNPPAGDRSQSAFVACGLKPEPGEDSRIEYTFDPDKQAGELQEDGSIDLRERNEVVAVSEGQLLAKIFPASPGSSGVNLAGHSLEGTEGEKAKYSARENVKVENDEEGVPKFFFSAVDGHVKVKENTISVHPVVYINGDIDYDLGNIDTGQDVHIGGSVKSGFSIKAGGSISIEGIIESSCNIYAEGDIIAAKGIVGDTKIVALGDVETKFVQNSQLIARGDINIGSYLLNANVRTGGKLQIHSQGGARGGTIVGGEVFATKGIKTRRIGSESTGGTLVGIGADPQVSAQVHKLDKSLKFCQSNIVRIFRTLGIKDIDAADFREIIQKAPVGKRKAIMELLQKLKQLVKTREQSTKTRNQLERKITELVDKAEIYVTDKAFADARVSIGNDTLTLDQDLENVVFSTGPGGIGWKDIEQYEKEKKGRGKRR